MNYSPELKVTGGKGLSLLDEPILCLLSFNQKCNQRRQPWSVLKFN
jgi:hypothetical protein